VAPLRIDSAAGERRHPAAGLATASGGRGLRSARLAVAWSLALALASIAPSTSRAADAPADAAADAEPHPSRLGGVLDWSPRLERRWPWAATWLFPVGDSLSPCRDEPEGTMGYRMTRGVSLGENGTPVHYGADLSNRRPGGIVRAVANGVVVSARRVSTGDYGLLVVIAHRLPDRSVAYSVYAHLRPKSLRVKPGEVVRAGQAIARVGRSGRATTDHLHFEIRRPSDLDERWEKTRPVDPVAFVTARFPAPRTEGTWPDGYLT
jgi:murein DD-endopeptidase MepM/ murein hydrolase activator NlpD